ncbi:hypothetical protein J2S74_002916 [Evansella vedderi]|uniref:Uncharacterized protein n=1 Tax=Evansella vedderi TaxID=38282 RepID=A0ABT9ZXE2_9BACI|nr:hypothetical protein [Evansella vedderi]MDQ0255534.1 hypothetical protein [Evansella vedderi]
MKINREVGYNEPKLLKVEGKGKTRDFILGHYIELIEHSGYNLTIDEISNYLRCSYNWVAENMMNEIWHIRVNSRVGEMAVKELDSDNPTRDFFYKRVLFNRDDFYRYMKENAWYIQSSKCFLISDFAKYEWSELIKELEEHKNFNEVSKLMQRAVEALIPRYFTNKPIKKKLKTIPEKLWSQKDFFENGSFQYKPQFYRFVETRGLGKIILGNFVRYDQKELEEQCLCSMPITLYENLYPNAAKTLLKQAKELLKT